MAFCYLAFKAAGAGSKWLSRMLILLNSFGGTERLGTKARFSEEVVASISQAIDRLQAAAGAKSVEFIGYSGGAARRHDVGSVVTEGYRAN